MPDIPSRTGERDFDDGSKNFLRPAETGLTAWRADPAAVGRKRRAGPCSDSSKRLAVGVARLIVKSRAAAQIGTRGITRRVVRQFGQAQNFVDQQQSGRRTIAHSDGDSAIQRNHGRRLDTQQRIVKPDDLRPVGLRPGLRFGVHRGDCCLQGVAADPTRAQRLLGQCLPFGDNRAIPAGPILLFQADELPGGNLTRMTRRDLATASARAALSHQVPATAGLAADASAEFASCDSAAVGGPLAG